jgi:hypothetical protein
MRLIKRLLRTLYNALDYRLRHLIAFQRGKAALGRGQAGLLDADLPPERKLRIGARQRELHEEFPVNGSLERGSAELQLKKYYYLDLLETALRRSKVSLPDPVRAADVGPSHWFYVQALWNILAWWGRDQPRQVDLHGYETDPYRMYRDFYSRIDHARAHINGLEGVTYHPSAFTRQPTGFDFIGQFFPFVFLSDHLKWGLPRRHFAPLELMNDIWASLRPAGVWVILNQGKEEFLSQERLLELLDAVPLVSFQFESPFYTYQHPTRVTVMRKPEDD